MSIDICDMSVCRDVLNPYSIRGHKITDMCMPNEIIIAKERLSAPVTVLTLLALA